MSQECRVRTALSKLVASFSLSANIFNLAVYKSLIWWTCLKSYFLGKINHCILLYSSKTKILFFVYFSKDLWELLFSILLNISAYITSNSKTDTIHAYSYLSNLLLAIYTLSHFKYKIKQLKLFCPYFMKWSFRFLERKNVLTTYIYIVQIRS